MKKLFTGMAVLLLTVFLLTSTNAQALSKGDKAAIMELTGIVSGSQIKNKKQITRGEFARMVVKASPYGKKIKNKSTARIYSDVPLKHKQAVYIQIAAEKGYMTGYLGGKFKPDKPVTMREAVYGLLKLLGYKMEDFANGSSRARFQKYKELGLDQNVFLNEGDKLTRQDCTNLFYNLLKAKTKEGNMYGESFGYSLNEDGEIDTAKLFNKLTQGPLIVKKGWEKSLPIPLKRFKIYQEEILDESRTIPEYSIVYYSSELKKLWVYDKKVYGIIEEVKKEKGKIREITIGGQGYPADLKDMGGISGEKQAVKGLPVVLFLGKEEAAAGVLPMETALWKNGTGKEKELQDKEITLYKNGVLSDLSALEQNDVIYYSLPLKKVWAYNKKEYGTVEKILPSQSAPEEIIIEGKTYSLKNLPIGVNKSEGGFDKNAWGKHLSANKIKPGDNVVILFGYNSAVADILPFETMPLELSGYVLKVEQKAVIDQNKNAQVKNSIRFVDTGGTEREVFTDQKNIVPGNIIQVEFKYGKSIVTKLTISSNNMDLVTKKIFSEDVKILDVENSSYARIYPRDLEGIPLTPEKVAYFKVNGKGQVSDLILRNVTGTLYQYGILKKAEWPETTGEEPGGKTEGRFVIDLKGEEAEYMGKFTELNITTGPKGFVIENNTVKKVIDLYEAAVAYIEGNQINTGKGVFRISSQTPVYLLKNGIYYITVLDSVSDLSKYHLIAYTEHAGWQGGQVKLMVASSK